MRKNIIFLFFLFLSLLFVGCTSKKNVAIKIGKIEITKEEFDDAFSNSSYAKQGKSKEEFLENFISRKLILKEAERLGLDKDPKFLKNIQLFWEQSLLKMTLSRKIKELSFGIHVSDKEVRDYYLTHQDDFKDKKLEEVYDRIKWILFAQKQRQAIQDWINSLKEKTPIYVDYKALGIKKK